MLGSREAIGPRAKAGGGAVAVILASEGVIRGRCNRSRAQSLVEWEESGLATSVWGVIRI